MVYNQKKIMRESGEKNLKKEKGTKNACIICENPSPEVQIILGSLKNKLLLKIKQIADDYQASQQRNNMKPINSFYSLLNIIFGQEILLSSGTDTCLHSKTFNDFKKKLRCTHKTLKQASQALSYDLASRNYHFQLLNQQISSISHRLEKRLEPNQILALEPENKDVKNRSLELKWLKKKKKQAKFSEKLSNQKKMGSSEQNQKERKMLLIENPMEHAEKEQNVKVIGYCYPVTYLSFPI